ncbi:MAG: hypothetical protein IJ190_14350 [Prevotella sp.]|nr:hypothetical protein [Prevotella sp.]
MPIIPRDESGKGITHRILQPPLLLKVGKVCPLIMVSKHLPAVTYAVVFRRLQVNSVPHARQKPVLSLNLSNLQLQFLDQFPVSKKSLIVRPVYLDNPIIPDRNRIPYIESIRLLPTLSQLNTQITQLFLQNAAFHVIPT